MELDTETIYPSLSYKHQLKIITAGIWHNITLCFFTLLLLLSQPYYLLPLYTQPIQGVHIYSIVDNQTGISQSTHIRVGSIITHVNEQTVNTIEQWRTTLLDIQNQSKNGRCVNNDVVNQNKQLNTETEQRVEGLKDRTQSTEEWLKLLKQPDFSSLQLSLCCSSQFAAFATSSAHHCYSTNSQFTDHQQQFCIESQAIQLENHICSDEKQCFTGFTCAYPQLDSLSQQFFSLTVQSPAGLELSSFRYIGTAEELFKTLLVNQLQVRNWMIWLINDWKFLYQILITVPSVLSTLFRYLLAVSASLAFFNCFPFYFTDGSQLIQTLFQLYREKYQLGIEQQKRKLKWAMRSCHGLVVLNCLISLL